MFHPKIFWKALFLQHRNYLRVEKAWGAMDRLGGVPTFGLEHPGLGEEGLGLAKPGLGEEGLGLATPGLGEEGVGGTIDSLAELLC